MHAPVHDKWMLPASSLPRVTGSPFGCAPIQSSIYIHLSSFLLLPEFFSVQSETPKSLSTLQLAGAAGSALEIGCWRLPVSSLLYNEMLLS